MKNLRDIQNILSHHEKVLKKKYQINAIGIFGSFARGEQNETSDVDLLVVFDEVPDLLKFVNLERYLEDLLELKVDLVRKQAIRKELKQQIMSEVIMA